MLMDKDAMFMVKPSEYHLRELSIVENSSDPRRNLPKGVVAGWRVLDVGCGIGQSLMASEFLDCERHGIDIDADAIAAGSEMFPELYLRAAQAENIPHNDQSFDLVFSRVAIPYTNIPRALREIFRVVKPGGRVWISLHPWSMEKEEIVKAIKTRSAKRLIDRIYVMINSMCLAIATRCFARPWSGKFESFQLPSRMQHLVRRTGFEEVGILNDRFFTLVGKKSASP